MVLFPVVHSLLGLVDDSIKTTLEPRTLRSIQSGYGYAFESISYNSAAIKLSKSAIARSISSFDVALYSTTKIHSIALCYLINSKNLLEGLDSYLDLYRNQYDESNSQLSNVAVGDNGRLIRLEYFSEPEKYLAEVFIMQTVMALAYTYEGFTVVDISNQQVNLNTEQFSKESFQGIFNSTESGIYEITIHSDPLISNPFFNESLFESVLGLNRLLYSGSDKFTCRIQSILHNSKHPNKIKLSNVASQMNVSSRGLTRKLKETNNTFKNMQRQAIYWRVLFSISSTTDFDDLAIELGYSDRSGLAHLIKDITGFSLTEFGRSINSIISVNIRKEIRPVFHSLKPMPETVRDAVKECSKEDFQINSLVRMIQSDLGASTFILKIAASPQFNMSAPTLKSVIVTFGNETIAKLLISNSIMNSIPEDFKASIPIGTILKLPNTLYWFQSKMTIPNPLGSVATFLPIALCIVFSSTFEDMLGINTKGMSYLDLMEIVNLKLKFNTTSMLKLTLSFSQFPISITKTITNEIDSIDRRYGEQFLDYCLQAAILIDSGNQSELREHLAIMSSKFGQVIDPSEFNDDTSILK